MSRVASSKTALIMAIIIKDRKNTISSTLDFHLKFFFETFKTKKTKQLSLKINRQVFRLENNKPKRFAGLYIRRITKRITYEVD